MDCDSFPQAIFPSGINTRLFSPARAAYAAIAAEVFPVDAHATHSNPLAAATLSAAVIPQSLKEPVGFMPWCFASNQFSPSASADRDISYKGVFPSRSVMMRYSATIGRRSRNRQTPL